MDLSRIGELAAGAGTALPTIPRDDPAKVHDAAQQFEALLVAQLLREARGSEGGWLGSGGGSSDCLTGLAEEHLAMLLAKQGGLGLARLIEHGLRLEESELRSQKSE